MKPSIARSSWHHAVASLERAATSSGSLRSCRFLPHTILDGGVVVGMQVGEKTFLAEAPTLWQALREAQEKDRHLAFPVVIQAIRRQRFHDRKFLLQPFAPAEVLGAKDLAQELVVFNATGEVPATAQEQRLVDPFFDPVVGLFHIPILIRLARLILRRVHAVVAHQRQVRFVELPALLAFEGGSAEIVCTMMPGRNTAQEPQCFLQTGTQGFKAFTEADFRVFPVGEGQDEVTAGPKLPPSPLSPEAAIVFGTAVAC